MRDGCGVDIVLCIDVTGSMSPVLEKVKKGALSFHQRLESVMVKRDMAMGRLRLRVIAFRDFGADGDRSIERTPFLELPQQVVEFKDFVNALKATGGGDAPESGLEALALAVQSPWSREERGGAERHIVVMFTDAAAHPLGKHTPGWQRAPLASRTRSWLGRRRGARDAGPASGLVPVPGYDGDVYPCSLDELHGQWGRPGHDGAVMDQSAKRLLVFAPEAEPWRDLAETWDKTLFVPSRAGTGLEAIALDEVISTIARSL